MIIVKITGGLGNQMFQYAVGRTLAFKNKTDLKLDLSFYDQQEGVTPRQFGLDVFNISAPIANIEEKNRLINGPWPKIISKIGRKLGLRLITSYVKEESPNFDQAILSLKAPLYLEGHFQSPQYFSTIREKIVNEFSLKDERKKILDPFLIAEIEKENSVSVHVRRGDYVTSQTASTVHGVVSSEYYRAAAKYLAEKIKSPKFFVFSEFAHDLDWCRANLNLGYPAVFVPVHKPEEDLFYIASCRHQIIANSSFSWWGAWLNKNPEKIIIAPKHWFISDKLTPHDLIPENWIRI